LIPRAERGCGTTPCGSIGAFAVVVTWVWPATTHVRGWTSCAAVGASFGYPGGRLELVSRSRRA
jgi:hypothetical protein